MLQRISELVRKGIVFPRTEANHLACTLTDGRYRVRVRPAGQGIERGGLEISLDVRRGPSGELAVTAHVRDGGQEPTDRGAFRFGMADQGKVNCALDLKLVKLVDIWHAGFADKNPEQPVLYAHYSVHTDQKLRFGSQLVRDVQIILGAETNLLMVNQWEKGPAKKHAIESSASCLLSEAHRLELQAAGESTREAMSF
jgi:hypothetical protein